jgi:hypothetical protein
MVSVWISVPDCPHDRHLWDWIDCDNHSVGRRCHRCGMSVRVWTQEEEVRS